MRNKSIAMSGMPFSPYSQRQVRSVLNGLGITQAMPEMRAPVNATNFQVPVPAKSNQVAPGPGRAALPSVAEDPVRAAIASGDLTAFGNFNAAFGQARKMGLKEFTWKGKRYAVKLANSQPAAPAAAPPPPMSQEENIISDAVGPAGTPGFNVPGVQPNLPPDMYPGIDFPFSPISPRGTKRPATQRVYRNIYAPRSVSNPRSEYAKRASGGSRSEYTKR